MTGRVFFLSLVLTLLLFSAFVLVSAKSNVDKKNVKRQTSVVASKPTTSAPTTIKPTTVKPTTAKPTTVKPTTAKPTTVKPTTVKPTTVKPTTVKPTTVKPTTVKPTTAKPTTVKPTTHKPTTHKPTTVKPTTVKPTTVKPTTHKPTTHKPTTVKPTTHKPTTVKPTTHKPTTNKMDHKPTGTMKPKTHKPTHQMDHKPTGTMKPKTPKPTKTTKKPTVPKVDPCANRSENNCTGACLPFKYHLFNTTNKATPIYGGCAKKQSKLCNIKQKNRCAMKLGFGPSVPLLTIVSGCPPAGLFAEHPCSNKEETFKKQSKMTFKAKDNCAQFDVETKQTQGKIPSTLFNVTAVSTTSNNTAISELLFTFSLKSGKKFTASSVWGLTSGRLSDRKNLNSVFIPGSPALLLKGQKRRFGFTLPQLALTKEYEFTITCKKTNNTAKDQKKSKSYPIIMVVAIYQEKSFKESMIYIFAQQKMTITENMIQIKVLSNKKRQTSNDTTLSVTINDPNGEASDTFLSLYNSNSPSIAASGLAIKSAAASNDGTTPVTTTAENDSPSSSNDDDDSSVSPKVWIAVGVCLGVVVIALLIMTVFLVRLKRKANAAAAHQALYE